MSSSLQSGIAPLDSARARAVAASLGLDVQGFESSGLALELESRGEAKASALRARVDEGLDEDGTLILLITGQAEETDLAAWRNSLWPLCHTVAILRTDSQGELTKRTLHGKEALGVKCDLGGVALVAQRKSHALAPKKTIEKFDGTAAGWNGFEGTPGYPHHRWMRRFVGNFAETSGRKRILDFGCGAGWVGIEAALGSPGCSLSAFDPSPAMVEFTRKNAKAAGIADFTGRTGFGEEPPFPAKDEERYDLVISSGVISFARDADAWFEGLANATAPGGTLVIGDIHRLSRGMRHRRRTRALLPIREMNAFTREEARAELERRGFLHEVSCGYQLTTPIPQAMHFSETRLGGLLTWPILLANMASAGIDRALGSPLQNQFDSWVMRFKAPE